MTTAAGQPTLPQTLTLSPNVRRALVVVPPLVFAAFEVFHPNPEENAQAVMDVATWFAVFHVIQLFLVGFIAVSVLILASDFGALGDLRITIGLGVFLIFFSAYDAVAGIGTGLAMRSARDLPAVQQDGVWETVKDWPGTDMAVFSLAIVGTLGWVVALVSLALVARRADAGRGVWLPIAAAGIVLMGGHPFPFGTVAFGCLFVAALLHVSRFGARRPSLSG